MRDGGRVFNLRTGEYRIAIGLLIVLAVNSLVLQLVNVVATAGFVSQVGVEQILWLWVVDMIIGIAISAAYALVVDRVARIRLLSVIVALFALLYLAMFAFIQVGNVDVGYALLYLLSDQQYVVFPLAFWALAQDLFTVSESKRLFPFIGPGAAIGNIAGNALAAGAALNITSPVQSAGVLLMISVLLLLGCWALIQWTFRGRKVRARRSPEAENIVEATREGFDVIWNVPLFRYLGLVMILWGFALTVLEYHFLATLSAAARNDPLQFQSFYGAYRTALVITTLLVQWLVTWRLTRRVALRDTVLAAPAVLAGAVVFALAIPSLFGAAAGRFVGWLMERTWNEPTRRSMQMLVPDERRGRVAVFIESYFYAFATIIACILLGILIALGSAGVFPQAWLAPIYLIVAAVATAIAIVAALRLRRVYDESLLNWRLSRSHRKSVLDGINF